MFVPSTELCLLNVPLTDDYSNTLWFPNVATQTAYMQTHVVKRITAFNYIKKDNAVVIEGDVDSYYNCNYVMYRNNTITTKWFYAFILRTEWASSHSTRLYLATDVIQTWFFNITYFDSYVDRCHSDTDLPGDNIVPEDFGMGGAGGYYQVGSQDLTPNAITVFATTDSSGNPVSPFDNTGIFSGSGSVKRGDYNKTDLANTLNAYVRTGMASAISRIQQWPENHDQIVSYAKRPTHLDCLGRTGLTTYIPTNKKLLSGAFITGYFSMYGQEMEFNPEYINGANINAKISVDETSGTVGVMLTNYGNVNISTMCLTAVIPEATWAYNEYKNNWNYHGASNSIMTNRLSQQRTVNKITSVADSVASAIGTAGAITDVVDNFGAKGLVSNLISADSGFTNMINDVGKAVSSASNTVGSISNAIINTSGLDEITQNLTYMQECYNAPAVGNVSQSNIFITSKKTALSYGFKVPPLDVVERCDKYLTVYGYKQSVFRSINLHARASWTFIRVPALNAYGSFPDEDLNIIKSAFKRGIFFWSYTATVGDFSQNNMIV